MSKFTNTLLVSPLLDGEPWIIMSDFNYDVGEQGRVNVKTGFVTDFALIEQGNTKK